jgi:methionyl-tRNA formyltransferase
MDLLLAASGEYALPSLAALTRAGHRLVRVYSQPDRPAGRGRHPTPTPVSAAALAAGLPLARTVDLNTEALPAADLLVVIAFGQKLAPTVVDHCRLGSLNLHASLLPRWRGAAPIHHAILAGDTITGNSVIRVAPRMDAGAVLAHMPTPIGPLETAGELHDRLAHLGAALLTQTITALEQGSARETPQDEARATRAPKLHRDIARLDFTRRADELARTIRGLFPWPGCRVRLIAPGGEELGRLTLARARASGAADSQPGVIDAAGHIGAGQGAVEILEVLPEGRRLMSLADYRNGHPWAAGLRLESVL